MNDLPIAYLRADQIRVVFVALGSWLNERAS